MSAPPPVPVSPYLSAENLRQLEAARVGSKRVRRAIAVAQVDGYTIGAFAALTVLLSITSPAGLVLGLAMGAVAFVELKNVGRLKRLDPGCARVLGWNQLALAGLLAGYSAYRIVGALVAGPAVSPLAGSDPELARMMQPIADLTRMIDIAVYAGLLLATLAAQGGLALFYFSRARHIRAYLQQTPGWIVELQRASAFL